MIWIGITIGFFIGGAFGVALMCILNVAGGDNDGKDEG